MKVSNKRAGFNVSNKLVKSWTDQNMYLQANQFYPNLFACLFSMLFTTKYVQGQPLGFDTKYLALADRNMQVKFSLKVVWGS